MTRIAMFIVGAVFSVLLLACGLDLTGRDESPSYLEETRPACVRLSGSTADPCERRDGWIVHWYPSAHLDSVSGPDLPIDVETIYRTIWDQGETTPGLMTPQIVMRGIVIPGSPRCVEFQDYVLGLYDDGPGYADSDRTGEVCYVDVAVSEYLVGTGPKTLPVVVGWRNGVATDGDSYGTAAYYDRVAKPIENNMGGFEFVIALARPINMAWGEWGLVDVWDVQRRSDGEIIAQHELYSLAGKRDDKAKYEYVLADVQQKIRDAHATLSVEFNGRLGAGVDDPKLVSDANRSFLLAQLRELGAFDIAGITPKSAP